jgi:hypothetical protein
MMGRVGEVTTCALPWGVVPCLPVKLRSGAVPAPFPAPTVHHAAVLHPGLRRGVAANAVWLQPSRGEADNNGAGAGAGVDMHEF